MPPDFRESNTEASVPRRLNILIESQVLQGSTRSSLLHRSHNSKLLLQPVLLTPASDRFATICTEGSSLGLRLASKPLSSPHSTPNSTPTTSLHFYNPSAGVIFKSTSTRSPLQPRGLADSQGLRDGAGSSDLVGGARPRLRVRLLRC
jgi:hypothetical protein